MFEQIKNKVHAIKRAAGIELTFTTENFYIINCLLLEVKNGKAVITSTFYNLKSVEELKNKIPALTPVSLILNGKGLIHKSIIVDGDILPSDILPGINSKDFLFETYNDEKISEVAIIRKSVVEKIIAELTIYDIHVISLSLAFYDFKYIAQIVNQTGNISTTQYNIDFSNKSIVSYKITSAEEKEMLVKEEINVGTEYIKSNFIIAYGAALKILVNGLKDIHSVKLEKIKENQKKLYEASLFKFYSFSLLATFLLLLLINFFIFSNYFSMNNDLLSNYQFSLMQSSKSDSLRLKIVERKKFLLNAGWLNNSKMISFYADRIALTVPDSVTLTSLNINPAVSKFSANSKQWTFQQDTIIITGICNDPTLLDMWQIEIQGIKNVKQAKISSFILKKQGEDGIFVAEVIIK